MAAIPLGQPAADDQSGPANMPGAIQLDGPPQFIDDMGSPKKSPGIMDALSGAAKRSAIPTAAFMAGAQPGEAAGAAAGAFGGPFAPVTVPAGAIVGGLITGGLAAYGASKVQDKYLADHPELAQKLGIDDATLQAEHEAHPIASDVGGLVPQALMLRPSPSTMIDLLGKNGAGAAAKAGGKVLGGAVIAGGVDAAQQYADTGTVDPTELALQAAGGGLLHEPWLLHTPVAGVGRMATPGALRRAGDRAMGRQIGTLPDDTSAPVDILSPETNPIRQAGDQLALPAPTPEAPTYESQVITDPRKDETYSADAVRDRLKDALAQSGGDPDMSTKDIDVLAKKMSAAMQAGDTSAVVDELSKAQQRVEGRTRKLERDRTDLEESVKDGLISTEDARTATRNHAITDRVLTQAKSLIDPALDIASQYETHKAAYDQRYAGDVPKSDAVLTTPPPPRPTSRPPEGVTLRTVPNNGKPEYGQLPPNPPPRASDTVLAEQLRAHDQQATREAQFQNMGPTDAVTQLRGQALDKVLTDGAVNPTRKFTSELRRMGLAQHIEPHEAERIAKFEDARAAFTKPPEQVASAPDESGDFGIPERKGAEAAPEEVAAVAPAAEAAPVEQNIRTRAEAAAEKLGSSRRAWFLRGVDQETGVHEQTPPESKSKATWFEEGRQFVRDEQAHQARERGEPEPAPVPKVEAKPEPAAEAPKAEKAPAEKPSTKPLPQGRGGRKTFLAEVDKAVGTKITARDAQVLSHAESLEEDIGGKPTRTVPTSELWSMLDKAVAEHDKEGGLTEGRKQRVTRRGVFKGALGTLAGGAAHASEMRVSLKNKAGVMAAIKSGSLKTAVAAIRDTSTNPFHRELARIMSVGGFGKDAKLSVEDHGDAQLDVLGSTDPHTGSVTLYNTTNGRHGLTEETLLHEALHSFLVARYEGISTYLTQNRAIVKMREQQGDKFVEGFQKLWTQFHDMMDAKFPALIDTTGTFTEDLVKTGQEEYSPQVWAQEAHSDPDELFVRSLTDPDMQKFLKTIDINGNKIAVRDPNSWWNKIVDFFAKMMGIKRTDTSAFSKIMDASMGVLKAGALDPPSMEYSQKLTAKMGEQANERLQRFRKSPAGQAETEIKSNLEDAGKKGWMWVSTTRDIARAAKDLLPSAGRFIEANSSAHALARSFEDRLADLKTGYEQLDQKFKGNGKGTVNELLDDMTAGQKWAFAPHWNAKAVVDPEMAARFKRMPEDAQKVVKETFNFWNDARRELGAATVKAVEAEYDPLIAAATDDAQRTQLTDEKARKLGLYSRVFDTRDDTPYAPRARTGDYVAVGKSQAFMDAEKDGDHKALDALREDANHYWVRFYDSLGKAKAAADRAKQAGSYPSTQAFQRDAHTDLDIGGQDMYLAFNQLRTKLQHQLRDTPGSESAKRLYQLATDLYLHALSDASARKAELQSHRVAGKDPVTGDALDMMQATVSRGRSTAHLVANLGNMKEVHASIDALHQESGEVPDAKRADAQRFKNALLSRYVENLNRPPQKLTDKALRANAIWSLMLKPGYHIQNASQTVAISLPQIAAVTSYPRAWREVLRAYGEVSPLVKDWTGDRVDIRKLANPTLRMVAQTMQDRGLIGTGMSLDLGSWEMDGNGLLPKAWNPVDKALRKIPQNIEDVNRLTAAIAAFRSAKTKGWDDARALDFAGQVVEETHGDYSNFNTPDALKIGGGIGRVALQFRKFQLIMAALNAKMFHRAFTSEDMTPEQQWVARRAIAYTMAHQVALAGIKGLPGIGAVGALTMLALGKPMQDWDQKAKEKLDDFFGKDSPMSGMLLKGAPYGVLKTDLSNTLGMATVFSPVPFTKMPASEASKNDFAAMVGNVVGGSLWSTVYRSGIMATQFANEGDYYRALESFLPNGPAGVMTAYRYGDRGLTSRTGDVLLKPEELSEWDKALTAVGLPSAKVSDVQDARAYVMDQQNAFSDRVTLLNRRYLNASREGDTDEMAKIRADWTKMNEAKVAAGLRPSPMTNLVRGPGKQDRREARTIGGVQYTPSNVRMVTRIAPGS